MAKIRNEKNYEDAIKQLNPKAISVGIKSPFPFNILKYYVAKPGFLKCLGHDLFEGVVFYGMAIYIHYFVSD